MVAVLVGEDFPGRPEYATTYGPDAPQGFCKNTIKLNADPRWSSYRIEQKLADSHRYRLGVLGVVPVWGDKWPAIHNYPKSHCGSRVFDSPIRASFVSDPDLPIVGGGPSFSLRWSRSDCGVAIISRSENSATMTFSANHLARMR